MQSAVRTVRTVIRTADCVIRCTDCDPSSGLCNPVATPRAQPTARRERARRGCVCPSAQRPVARPRQAALARSGTATASKRVFTATAPKPITALNYTHYNDSSGAESGPRRRPTGGAGAAPAAGPSKLWRDGARAHYAKRRRPAPAPAAPPRRRAARPPPRGPPRARGPLLRPGPSPPCCAPASPPRRRRRAAPHRSRRRRAAPARRPPPASATALARHRGAGPARRRRKDSFAGGGSARTRQGGLPVSRDGLPGPRVAS
jgi:hypothetical protein